MGATFFLHATCLTSQVLSSAQRCAALDMCMTTVFLHATYLSSLVWTFAHAWRQQHCIVGGVAALQPLMLNMCIATFCLHAATFFTSLVLTNSQCCVALDMCMATFFLHATCLTSQVLSSAQRCAALDMCMTTVFLH